MKVKLAPGQRRVDLGVSFLVPGTDSLALDGLPLAPDQDYRLDTSLGRVELFREHAGAILSVTVRRQPLPLPRLLALRPLTAWREMAAATGAAAPPPAAGAPPEARRPAGGELNLGGSKSLVVRVGSGEDVALEQTLRLQLEGRLSDSTRVEAVLRDDDLPFQPEGNTERLEELDKVFLRVTGPAGRAQVGDFVFAARERELTPFDRDFQGIEGEVAGARGAVGAWLARSQGVFRSAEFWGEEGLQGPYELLSALRRDGAVILAGSEAVTVNGRRLARGRDQDYTIDYGQGTLSFTHRVPVGAGDLIRVDFRYSQEAWRRGAWGASARGRLGPLRLDWLHFDERDDTARPLAFTLTDERRDTLAAAGDDPERAIAGGVIDRPGEGRYVLTHENPADPEQDTYAWVDSLGDYDLRLREMGAGRGDYRLAGISDAGERIYAYAGPGGGSFALGEALPLPEGYRLESLRLDWAAGAARAEAELALSDRDANLLSDLDDGDNRGLAGLLRLAAPLAAPGGRPLTLSLSGRHRDEDFHFPGASRGAGHYRSWNLPENTTPGRETDGRAVLAWGDPAARGLEMSGEGLRLGGRFTGWRGGLRAAGPLCVLAARGTFQATATEDSLLGDGHREETALGLDTPWFLLRGLDLTSERAGRSTPDSLEALLPPERRTTFDRARGRLRLGSRGGGPAWRLVWSEERIAAGSGEDRVHGLDGGVRGGLPGDGRLDLGGSWQKRAGYLDSERFLAESRATWLPRGRAWSGETLYRLGSNRQRLRQTQLVNVGPGQGDLNEDGVYVGEGEGEWRRLTLLAEEAARTNTLELEGRLRRQESRDGGAWGRLGGETSLTLREETRDTDLWGLAILRPSHLFQRGETLVGELSLRQELRWRPRPGGTADLRWTWHHRDRLDERDLLGRREEKESGHALRLRRAGADDEIQLQLRRECFWRRSQEGLGRGRYDVRGLGVELEWTRHLPRRWQVGLRGGLAARRDRDRVLALRELTLEPRLSLSPFERVRLDAGWELRRSDYTEGTPGADRPWFFDAPGWSRRLLVEATAQPGSNLSLAATYELREEADSPRRHRLRLESRAYF
ncbi:MAG: hypothetical protein JW819_07115 [Candidatus Krumholzibacteriota bacterium]|nr:hypothetical protein [Candidatus Krumholzibacteriota bacterium]